MGERNVMSLSGQAAVRPALRRTPQVSSTGQVWCEIDIDCCMHAGSSQECVLLQRP